MENLGDNPATAPEKLPEVADTPTEEVFGAVYPDSESPSEILDRRVRNAQAAEVEKRARGEVAVRARVANPHALVDYHQDRP